MSSDLLSRYQRESTNTTEEPRERLPNARPCIEEPVPSLDQIGAKLAHQSSVLSVAMKAAALFFLILMCVFFAKMIGGTSFKNSKPPNLTLVRQIVIGGKCFGGQAAIDNVSEFNSTVKVSSLDIPEDVDFETREWVERKK